MAVISADSPSFGDSQVVQMAMFSRLNHGGSGVIRANKNNLDRHLIQSRVPISSVCRFQGFYSDLASKWHYSVSTETPLEPHHAETVRHRTAPITLVWAAAKCATDIRRITGVSGGFAIPVEPSEETSSGAPFCIVTVTLLEADCLPTATGPPRLS